MKELIENLYPMNRCLLGEGYDNALEYLKHLIDLEVIEIPSGAKVGSWTVPDEWIVRDAWVKFNGEKIIDYKTQPLSLVVGSMPQHGIVDKEELRKHLQYSDELPNATPFAYLYYNLDKNESWGFSVPKNQVRKEATGTATASGVKLNGEDYQFKFEDALPDGEYEVFIDTEYRPGTMKIGVHTISGKSDREILLFAHLDHPFQANDNLSAVACLTDLSKKLSAEHTIKIIFCPETIGSIAYASTQDISKVDFVIAVDICGNDNQLLLQKSWDAEDRINRVAHVALFEMGESYRKGNFRNTIGSDEYFFNDPSVGIPGIMLSRWPYKEYHTSDDTPSIINYDTIYRTGAVIKSIIEIYEDDYIPVRNFKGPLQRVNYGMHSNNPQNNLGWDYFIYMMDGTRTLAELVCEMGLNWTYSNECVDKMVADGLITKKKINANLRPVGGKTKKSKARK